MDTTDYIQLLPIDGEDTVWQALDLDNNFFDLYSIADKVLFSRVAAKLCNLRIKKPFVCGHDYGPQNNWTVADLEF